MDSTTIYVWLFALLIRWIVSFHSYSGKAKSPMFGDYEAQRHWMEITVNLPASHWYTNTTENDLLYWGLDYPPLTAYHSLLMGKMAYHINKEWVALNISRGYESYHHKLFMRSTVFFSEIIFLFGLHYYWNKLNKDNSGFTYFFQSLIIPSFILIDHGHFQYNCISLGLFLWAIILLQCEHDILASVVYCLALNYKQISLYYSLPIFFYLLKRCFSQRSFIHSIIKLSLISLSVIITFTILWLPYIDKMDSILKVYRRIFPLNRGIYEDKVANFWYCLSILIKVKKFNSSKLAVISAILTLVTSLPSCYILFQQNTLKQLKHSLLIVSFSFFLFSFQVHEKTILFVNVCMMLLTDHYPFMVFWFSIIATFSLQPLLYKDELMIPYFALTIIYIMISQNTLKMSQNHILKKIFYLSIMMVTFLSCASLFVPAPNRYPHLHALINCVYSFVHFSGFFIYFFWKQFQLYGEKTFGDNFEPMTFIRPKKKIKVN